MSWRRISALAALGLAAASQADELQPCARTESKNCHLAVEIVFPRGEIDEALATNARSPYNRVLKTIELQVRVEWPAHREIESILLDCQARDSEGQPVGGSVIVIDDMTPGAFAKLDLDLGRYTYADQDMTPSLVSCSAVAFRPREFEKQPKGTIE